MSDAPERIWATGDCINGSWANEMMPAQWGLQQTEYIRADLAAANDARIAVLERQLAEEKRSHAETISRLAGYMLGEEKP